MKGNILSHPMSKKLKNKSTFKQGLNSASTPSAQYTRMLQPGPDKDSTLVALVWDAIVNQALPIMVRAVLELLFVHGCRLSEILNITHSDVTKNGIIRIKGLKGSGNRVIRPVLYMDFWQGKDGVPLPLVSVYSRFYFYRLFKKLGIVYTFEKGGKKAVTHACRFLLAHGAKEFGESGTLTKAALNHKSINSSLHYEKRV